MKAIWKFEINITDEQIVMMPKGSRPLTAQFQHEQLCIWALVDSEERERQPRRIEIHGTGNPIAESSLVVRGLSAYLGTVQQFNGQLVWHIFSDVL